MSQKPKKKTEKKEKKEKKEKVIYIDDGSTVVDMTGTAPARPSALRRPAATGRRSKPEPTTRAGQIRRTYLDAMRSMVGPMLVMIGGISVVFFLVWIILGFFA